LRHGSRERRLDRLLVAGIIEARSHERLELLAGGVPDPALKRLYAELARSEDGHRQLFVRLAKNVEEAPLVDERLAQLLDSEAELIETLPIRAAIH
jgi:tRNA-(ms[2]io[6]A)-hydroxylase